MPTASKRTYPDAHAHIEHTHTHAAHKEFTHTHVSLCDSQPTEQSGTVHLGRGKCTSICIVYMLGCIHLACLPIHAMRLNLLTPWINACNYVSNQTCTQFVHAHIKHILRACNVQVHMSVAMHAGNSTCFTNVAGLRCTQTTCFKPLCTPCAHEHTRTDRFAYCCAYAHACSLRKYTRR